MKHLYRRKRSDVAGFTLLEALVATTVMGLILAALGAITAQWLPSWNRGFIRVQRSELFAVALNRLAADLSASEFITPNRASKLPIFEGAASGVTLVRSAVGPNSEPGLEVVRFAESSDRQGIALVRTRTRFAPFGLGDVTTSQLNFTDPVVLLRAPFRVSFSYTSGDGMWSDTWANADQLPAAVRFLIRDSTSGRTLAISSATMVHVELPADCAGQSSQAGQASQAGRGSQPGRASQACGSQSSTGADASDQPTKGRGKAD
jgi:general secretion pathway protein J